MKTANGIQVLGGRTLLAAVLAASCIATPTIGKNVDSTSMTAPEQSSARAGQTPVVTLYEGNSLSQTRLCRMEFPVTTARGFTGEINLKKDNDYCSGENDEARSAKFEWVPAGTVLEFYDDPDCEKSDDWSHFYFEKTVASEDTSSFEYTGVVKDKTGDIVYRREFNQVKRDPLDGKVSCIKVDMPAYHD